MPIIQGVLWERKPRGLITLFSFNLADTATESYIIVIAITLGSILGLLLLIVIATVLGTCIRLRVRASRRKREDTGEILLHGLQGC